MSSISRASRNSVWTPVDQRRNSVMARPTWRPASGSFDGPSTRRATTKITMISMGPICGMGEILPAAQTPQSLAGDLGLPSGLCQRWGNDLPPANVLGQLADLDRGAIDGEQQRHDTEHDD